MNKSDLEEYVHWQYNELLGQEVKLAQLMAQLAKYRGTGDFPVPNCGNCKHWDSHDKIGESKACNKIVALGKGIAHIFTNGSEHDVTVLMTKEDFSCSLHEPVEIPFQEEK